MSKKLAKSDSIKQIKLCRVWIDKDMVLHFNDGVSAKLRSKKGNNIPSGLYWMSLQKVFLNEKQKKIVRKVKKQRYFGN